MRLAGGAGEFRSEENAVKRPKVRIKQRPEDFSVKESFHFEPSLNGRFRIYLMTKQKLSTFEAVEHIRQVFGLRPGAISYCGLKDKQGTTEQLVAIDGADVSLQEPRLRLKFLGRSDAAISAANTTSNRFAVTVRALGREDLAKLNASAAEVGRLGVVNYFDSQRFGSLKHGQGFIAKDLLRGDFESALRNYMGKPSSLDRSEDAKVKQFWKENWGKWRRRAPFVAQRKYDRILKALRDSPENFLNAFLQIDRNYRAMMMFTYQSYLWNEGVRRLLQLVLPREALFPQPYQAGTLLFHKDADPTALTYLRKAMFPLLAPSTPFGDDRIRQAAEWALAKERLTLEQLRVPGAAKQLFFKHEDRPVIAHPSKLVIGRPGKDEINAGLLKVNVAFTLLPGSYATLVIRRLFHFAYHEDTRGEIERSSARAGASHPARRPLAAPSPNSRRKPRTWLRNRKTNNRR
jgi:tRNA pseudouridine13 synthase